jgi:hypothetical protein
MMLFVMLRKNPFFHSSPPLPTQGSFILAWKRGIAILTAGEVKVTPDPRVRLSNGYTLQIREAVPSDAGDYICQIGTLEPREITHHVEILSKKTCPMSFAPRLKARTEKRFEQNLSDTQKRVVGEDL